MQTLEALKQFWIPDLDDINHYLAGISANALLGVGALIAFTTYWFASRKKAIKPHADLTQQSVELPVGGRYFGTLP